jgi:hypothetical protein
VEPAFKHGLVQDFLGNDRHRLEVLAVGHLGNGLGHPDHPLAVLPGDDVFLAVFLGIFRLPPRQRIEVEERLLHQSWTISR